MNVKINYKIKEKENSEKIAKQVVLLEIKHVQKIKGQYQSGQQWFSRQITIR